jgi:hypothetical protein
MVIIGTTTMICGSQDIKSQNGITYGGVDENGEKDPSSRRQQDVWEDEEEEEL